MLFVAIVVYYAKSVLAFDLLIIKKEERDMRIFLILALVVSIVLSAVIISLIFSKGYLMIENL